MANTDKPNVVYMLTDQRRAKATGYNGDPNAITPNINRLAAESIDFANAIGTSPVCTPARAILLTGRYPTTNGGENRKVMTPLRTVDIMPTLLSLCGLEIPDPVEGEDLFSRLIVFDESSVEF